MLEIDGWALEPAEAPHRGVLAEGARVKLFFVFELGDGSVEGERLWVSVTRASDGCYTGRLIDEPMSSGVLSAGDEVTFEAAHVVERG